MDHGTPILVKCFSEGVMSYLHERQREGCPYSRGSVEREIWLEGWNQTANAERKACLRFD